MANTVTMIMAAAASAAAALGYSVPELALPDIGKESSSQAVVAHVEAFTGAPVVVLGARLNSDCTAPGVLNERLDRTAAFSRLHPNTTIYVTGGKTQESCPATEAAAMEMGLRVRLVSNPIVREDSAGNTVENANNVSRMMGDRAVVVSNQDHLPRALKNFRDAGVSRAVGLSV